MEFKKVVAIIRNSELEIVGNRLKQLRVDGLSVYSVKGYGEHANLGKSDWMVTNAKIEIFVEQAKVDDIVSSILETARSGMVAILPVENLFKIHFSSELDSHEKDGSETTGA